VTYILTKQRIHYKVKMNRCDDKYSEKIIQAVENIDVIKCNNTEAEESDKFMVFVKKYLHIRNKDAYAVLVLHILQKYIYSMLLIGVLWHIYKSKEPQKTKVVSLIISLIKELDMNVMYIALSTKKILVSYVDCEEYLTLHDMLKSTKTHKCSTQTRRTTDISDDIVANTMYTDREYSKDEKENTTIQAQCTKAPYALEFRHIHFSYTLSNSPLFADMSFGIKKGEKVCIVGKSGCGKSTLISLILGKYKYSGTILVHGTNIETMHKDDITDIVGIVPQDSGMFTGTLQYNITYGCKNVTDSDFATIVQDLSLDSIIASKSEGLAYIVQEGGKNLSGGEKQRIALARTLLKKPDILIFDEATSKIDAEVEYDIVKYLQRLEQTVIVITHSPLVAEMMDRAIVLELAEAQQ